jgi:hypothetical protein
MMTRMALSHSDAATTAHRTEPKQKRTLEEIVRGNPFARLKKTSSMAKQKPTKPALKSSQQEQLTIATTTAKRSITFFSAKGKSAANMPKSGAEDVTSPVVS